MPTKQALAVGIDRYEDMAPLRYAANDANEFATALAMPEYNFETLTIIDENATTDELKSSVVSLLKGPADIKLIFFAGHGHSDEEGAYLSTFDASDTNLGVSLEWLRDQVLAAKNTVIVILDCCHSGAASVRSLSHPRGISDRDIDRSFGTLGTGKILLAACASDETTQENSVLSHGVFTFHLLEGLIGPAANFRGIVTPFGLFDYIATKAEEEGFTKPVFKGEQAGSVIVGAGLSPIPQLNLQPANPSVWDMGQDIIGDLEQQATRHLNDYLEQTFVPYENWKTEGYHKATQLLEPIMRWFERTANENPELLARPKFADAYSEAKARLTQLGAVSEGTFAGQGTVVKRLGAGAFGTVWEVVQPDGGRLAYKIYHPTEIEVKEKVARFDRGYRAMRQLEHPHIVRVYGDTRCPIGFYMDFIDGPNLRDFVGTISEAADLLALLIKIAETLQHAHRRKVIHRDVKPENIVLQYDAPSQTWIPYLTDFDLAWFSSATQLTKEAFGAIFYASPEQLSKPSSWMAHAPTTDVYSFGQLCFFVATGSDPVPFEGADNVSGLRTRIGDWRVAQAANIFAELYEKCTDRDPARRLQDFRTISDLLFEALTLIRETDPNEQIDQERFVTELVYSLAGLSARQGRMYDPFNSLSGRSLITVTDLAKGATGLDITLRVEQDSPSLAGSTTEHARRRLNASLDKAISEYPNVHRRPGTQGTYQVFLDVRGIDANLRGVEHWRSIVTRAIDAIESR